MVQKVAGAAPQTSYQQERKWQETLQLQHHSTDPFLCTTRMTIDVFLHIPDIRHMWLFQTPVTWCHLCVGHICSLLHWF